MAFFWAVLTIFAALLRTLTWRVGNADFAVPDRVTRKNFIRIKAGFRGERGR